MSSRESDALLKSPETDSWYPAYVCPKHGLLDTHNVRHRGPERRPECMINWFSPSWRCPHEPRPVKVVAWG